MRRKITPAIRIIVLLSCAFILFFIIRVCRICSTAMRQTGISPITVTKLLFDGGNDIASTDGRTNILLLGIAGGTHDGADLTDTMIVISITTKTHAVALISIPRDIWSDSLKDKINSAYHYGEEKKKDGGIILTKATVEDVIGLPIHYTFLINFSEFRQVIDTIGGIDVQVTKPFVDTDYPIDGKEDDPCDGDPLYRCRYQTVQFTAGMQHMDGATALIYARSRHAEGDEGTDFARSRRQQEIIIAMKEKILLMKPWFHLTKASQIYASFRSATKTDMIVGDQLTVAKQMMHISLSDVQKISIESLLTAPPTSWYGRYVLVPTEDFTAIHDYIRKQIQ